MKNNSFKPNRRGSASIEIGLLLLLTSLAALPLVAKLGSSVNDSFSSLGMRVEAPSNSEDWRPIVRINNGGSTIADPILDWDQDIAYGYHPTTILPEVYVVSFSATTDMTHPSLPADTPEALFASERVIVEQWGNSFGYSIPIPESDTYRVRLYFSENYVEDDEGFGVSINSIMVLTEFDIKEEAGSYRGMMKEFSVNSSSNIDIIFIRGSVGDPLVNAIEVLRRQAT